MSTYLELRAHAAAVLQQAEEARQAELQTVIREIRERVAEYGLTPEQVFGRKRGLRAPSTAGLPPKYRDPQTGATWSGRGRTPNWIKDKNRERFLIMQ
jgi:DNA-binding protein H-NS